MCVCVFVTVSFHTRTCLLFSVHSRMSPQDSKGLVDGVLF